MCATEAKPTLGKRIKKNETKKKLSEQKMLKEWSNRNKFSVCLLCVSRKKIEAKLAILLLGLYRCKHGRQSINSKKNQLTQGFDHPNIALPAASIPNAEDLFFVFSVRWSSQRHMEEGFCKLRLSHSQTIKGAKVHLPKKKRPKSSQ